MPDQRALGYATAAVLHAIRGGYRYGLDVMEAAGLPSGTVYPTLARMERRGYVTARWEAQSGADREGRPRRRYYELTAAGAAALDEAVRRFGAIARDARRAERAGDATGGRRLARGER